MADALGHHEDEYAWEVLYWGLRPTGGCSIDAPEGSIDVCGPFVPPSLTGIRSALRRADEAGADPEAIYACAVDLYRVLNQKRRQAHPERDWPAPSYRDVDPGTWPSLSREELTRIHVLRVFPILVRGADEAERIDMLRAVLQRAADRGADPQAVYLAAVIDYDDWREESNARPMAPSYAAVAPSNRPRD